MSSGVDSIKVTGAMLRDYIYGETGDICVGIKFTLSGKLYTYLAPASVHVGSRVLVPGNWYNSEPQIVRVLTVRPTPPLRVKIKRVLEVLS